MSFKLEPDYKIQLIANGVSDFVNATISVEECSELIKEITKKIRDPFRNNENMIEEMADVIISLEILMHTYGITNEQLQAMYEKKMTRNVDRKTSPRNNND